MNVHIKVTQVCVYVCVRALESVYVSTCVRICQSVCACA